MNSKLQARNEIIINQPVEKIYQMITDISQLHKINPGVIKAEGKMDEVGAKRHCTIDNRGKEGKMEEKCLELVPYERTVWQLEKDNVGFTKMMDNIRFYFHLKANGPNSTFVANETHYAPRHFIAALMNSIMMRKMVGKTQQTILTNLKQRAEQIES